MSSFRNDCNVAELRAAIPVTLHPTLNQLVKAANGDDIQSALRQATRSIPGFTEERPGRFRYRNLWIINALGLYDDRNIENVRKLNEAGINSVPKLTGCLKVGDFHRVIFYSYEGDWIPGQTPIPYDVAEEAVSPEARETFLKEMEKLADMGWYFPELKRSTASLYVNPTNGQILLGQWQEPERIAHGKKAEVLEAVRGRLCPA